MLQGLAELQLPVAVADNIVDVALVGVRSPKGRLRGLPGCTVKQCRGLLLGHAGLGFGGGNMLALGLVGMGQRVGSRAT